MMDDSFADFLDERVAAGQHGLADLGRRLVLERAPRWLERLDFDNDLAFLEPFLFANACADGERFPLDQVLAGYVGDEQKPPTVRVCSDDQGKVHLPGIGYVVTDQKGARLELSWDPRSRRYSLDESGSCCDAYGIHTIADGRVELLRSEPLVLRSLFGDAFPGADVDESARKHCASLVTAFEALKRVHARYYQNVVAATRTVIVFNSGRMNSFAALSCHGAAFLNAADEDGPVFFIEDIAHQCGHVVFNAVMFAGDELLKVPPDTPLKAYTRRDGERRSVCAALHGVFTEAVMVQCLDGCYEGRLFEGRQAHELIGRIAFILRRFGSDARSLSEGRLFTKLGEWVFGNILITFKAAYEKYGSIARALDFSNQPYTFSYPRFVKINGRR